MLANIQKELLWVPQVLMPAKKVNTLPSYLKLKFGIKIPKQEKLLLKQNMLLKIKEISKNSVGLVDINQLK